MVSAFCAKTNALHINAKVITIAFFIVSFVFSLFHYSLERSHKDIRPK